MTTELLQINRDKPNTIVETAYLPHIFGILCFAVPFFSINYSTGFYYSALLLLVVSLIYIIIRRPTAILSTQEKWLMIALVAYPLWAATDMLVRNNWDWNEFKEPSRFLLVIPVILSLRAIQVPTNYLYLGFFLGAIWAGSQGLYQGQYLGIYRANGGASHITAFGNISLMLGLLSITAINAYETYRKPIAVVAIIALALGLLGSAASGSKGGWLALPFLFWVIIDLSDRPTYTKRFVSLTIVLCIAISAYLISPLVQTRIDAVIPALMEYFNFGDLKDGSVGPRLEMWKVSLEIFTQHPIFGSGVGSYYNEKLRLIDAELADPRIVGYIQSHNQLLHSLAEGGVLGMVCVYSIYATLIAVFRSHYQNHKPLAVAGIILTIGFIDFGMADGIWSINNAGTFFAFVSAILVGVTARSHENGITC